MDRAEELPAPLPRGELVAPGRLCGDVRVGPQPEACHRWLPGDETRPTTSHRSGIMSRLFSDRPPIVGKSIWISPNLSVKARPLPIPA